MDISIIIPVYNAEKTIIQTLNGLQNQTRKDFEVIVIDDGSTDSSSELIEAFKKRNVLTIKLIKQKNAGPAKARNVGVEHSEGNKIIFLDSDCIPPENWIEQMIKPLNGKVVGCNCGYKVKNMGSLVARYVNYEIAKRHEKLIGKTVDTIGSYSASFIKSVVKEAGGFDIRYKSASYEDFDLAFNIRKIGYDLVFTDKTFVYHYHPDSLRRYLKQQFGRGYWGVIMYLRNKDKILKGDTYTGHEAQVQFILSCLVFLSIPLAVVVNPLFLLSFVVLLFSNLPLGLWASKKEKKFILIAPILASMRSLAGTLGVCMWFIKKGFK